ncbi:hypothetical protein [Actinacidiphila reveromycinica]|uniref:hypothetical protein n=1 Tax=Actinacidiphila reveromycinica TaxID=659352 RepID=UPI0019221CEE|nr:hypothetical protein [Streptomyces sp. SN-593]
MTADMELPQRLEALMDHLAPEETVRLGGPLLGLEPARQRWELVEGNRLALSRVLRRDLHLVRRHRAELLALLPLDGNVTNQLVFPLVTALGRRPVLRYIIDAVGQGGWPQRANASKAAYWVPKGPSVPGWEELFVSVRDGVMSVADARAKLRRLRAQPEQTDNDAVADLWPELWLASMRAFVDCDDDGLRRRLHTAFPLAAAHYPPEAAPLREEAERIALAQPERFGRLLDGSTGYGLAI